MRVLSYREAIREALYEELARDQNVVLLGQDIGRYGGCFKVTSGLLEAFGPHQVIESPVSEEALVAVGVGSAMVGMRPVVEVMYGDFSTLASDPLINHAAKLHFMSGGALKVPLVYRTPMGGGTGAAAQHTQNLESLFTNIPGLKIVWPATPKDAKGLLKSAIRDPNPVIFLEHKGYDLEGEVPQEEYVTPLGVAEVKKEGHDISVISYGHAVFTALEAADLLEKEGISVEVVDLRSLKPLDTPALRASVKKTGRALVLHEAPLFGGFGGEIVAQIVEDAEIFSHLKGRIRRLGGLEMPTPFNKELESSMVPSVAKVAQTLRSAVKESSYTGKDHC